MTAAAPAPALTAATVLSVTDAARALPFRAVVARAWLRDRDLVRDVPGLGRVVVWGDVLEALRLATEAPPPPPPAPRLATKQIEPRRPRARR